jgi:hypothetical protein
MEFHEIIPAINGEKTKERLLRVCRAFADTILMNEDWDDIDNRAVTYERSFTQVLGENDGEIKVANDRINAPTGTTTLAFRAQREVNEVSKNTFESKEYFTLKGSSKESIVFAELPEYIKQIVTKKIDESSTLQEKITTQGDIDAALNFKYEQEAIYYLNEDDGITDFSLTYRYFLNKEVVDSKSYFHDDPEDDGSSRADSSTFIEGRPVEHYDGQFEAISDEDVETFLASFDTVMDQIKTNEKIKELSKEIFKHKKRGSRRVLGMIAMLSTGLSAPGTEKE